MLPDKIDFFAYKDNFARYKDIESVLVYDSCTKKDPFITIAIPTYKRAQLLKDALDSALNQINFDNYEVIVIDNEDTFYTVTETEKLIKSYSSDNLKYYRNKKNIGMFGNWNRCIELARGEWITILNDDDMLANNYLETVIQYIEDKKMIIGNIRYFGRLENIFSNTNKSKKCYIKELLKKIYYSFLNIDVKNITIYDFFLRNPVNGCLGVLFHKKSAIEIGGYNEDYYPSSDYIFSFIYWRKFDIKKLPFVVAHYRWNQNESLKRETMEGFLIRDFLFRKQLISHFFKPKIKKYLLCNLNIIYTKITAYNYGMLMKSIGINEVTFYSSLEKIGIKGRIYFPKLLNKVIPKLIALVIQKVRF